MNLLQIFKVFITCFYMRYNESYQNLFFCLLLSYLIYIVFCFFHDLQWFFYQSVIEKMKNLKLNSKPKHSCLYPIFKYQMKELEISQNWITFIFLCLARLSFSCFLSFVLLKPFCIFLEQFYFLMRY